MEEAEVLEEVRRAAKLYHEGRSLNRRETLEESLEISLHLRKVIDGPDGEHLSKMDQFYHLDGGLNANIFNSKKLLGQFDGIIPYLEKTLEYLDNGRNPDLWRQLGLLYLVQEKDIDKACGAWKKAIEIDETIVEKFPGLNLVYTYNAMKSSRHRVSWEIIHADLESGEFSVNLQRGE